MDPKVKVIEKINELLTGRGLPPLNTHDFDILWDMDIDELVEAEMNIEDELRLLNKLP